MSILDAFRVNKIKAELDRVSKERDTLQATLLQTEHMDFHALQEAVTELKERKDRLLRETIDLEIAFAARQQEIDTALAKQRETGERRIQEAMQQLERQKARLHQEIDVKQKEVVILDDQILLQSFGFYAPKHDLANAEEYKIRLDQVRQNQMILIKTGRAIDCPTNWTVNNSRMEGERMVNDFSKIILRAFNNECDVSIASVKFNNVHVIMNKITKAWEALNKLGRRMSIMITSEYFRLKHEELEIYYEYQVKKQEEKEEQRLYREQLREEAKLAKELEEVRLKLAKEEQHFTTAIAAVTARLSAATNDTERMALERELEQIQARLDELEQNKQAIEERAHSTRAGYVYIISNIGAFGDNVYKIGVTRRLNPQERIDELGDASVPFKFDIHALIFSDDAPALENALHKAFEHRRLNMINRRREFFRVNLHEIEQVVKTNFSKPVEFIELPEAAQHRQSIMLRSELPQ